MDEFSTKAERLDEYRNEVASLRTQLAERDAQLAAALELAETANNIIANAVCKNEELATAIEKLAATRQPTQDKAE